MAASFLHGVETIDIKQGVRPVKETRSAVIGLVGTGWHSTQRSGQ